MNEPLTKGPYCGFYIRDERGKLHIHGTATHDGQLHWSWSPLSVDPRESKMVRAKKTKYDGSNRHGLVLPWHTEASTSGNLRAGMDDIHHLDWNYGLSLAEISTTADPNMNEPTVIRIRGACDYTTSWLCALHALCHRIMIRHGISEVFHLWSLNLVPTPSIMTAFPACPSSWPKFFAM